MTKSGLDFFPLDVNMDRKIALIEAEYGLKGFAVVVKLLQSIYGENGYYCELNDDVILMFAQKIGASVGLVTEILDASIRRGIFDERMFREQGILTSAGIQRRYLHAVSRRKQVSVKNDYLLISDIQKYKNVDIIGKNVNISAENADISEQSKVNKNNSRVKNPPVFETFKILAKREPTAIELDELDQYVTQYDAARVIQALHIMGRRGKLNMDYLGGILKNLKVSAADDIIKNGTCYDDVYK